MDDARSSDAVATERTTVERRSDRELVVTRWFDAPARLVFEAWSRPELFQRWWVPTSMSMTLHSCEMDVRTGGTYRLDFGDGMDFFGRYIEVTPPSRIVWTNDEGGADGSITTVTFEEQDGRTLLVMSELYPSKEALDAAGTGAADATRETFAQLDELLVTLHARGAAWLSAGFVHPSRAELPTEHHLRPIRASDADIDFPAVMGSRESLWAKYGEAWGWPPATMTLEQDREDLARHEREIAAHETFNYAVLNADETELVGCVYVDPPSDESPPGTDAITSWWVIDAHVGGALDSSLAEFVPRWLSDVWGFSSVHIDP